MDFGGWMFFVITVILVAILGGAMAYGTSMWRRRPRDPAIRQASERATWKLYHPHDQAR